MDMAEEQSKRVTVKTLTPTPGGVISQTVDIEAHTVELDGEHLVVIGGRPGRAVAIFAPNCWAEVRVS